ncbi:MAG: hypothetical protein QW258_01485 [Thermoplasmata archaeon]
MKMEKGLEIQFKIPEENRDEVAEAISNLVGNEFKEKFEIEWRIYNIEAGSDHFYKVCFIGAKMTRLHPLIEKTIKERFDELAKYKNEELLKLFHEARKDKTFKIHTVKHVKEDFDLWSDNFLDYF